MYTTAAYHLGEVYARTHLYTHTWLVFGAHRGRRARDDQWIANPALSLHPAYYGCSLHASSGHSGMLFCVLYMYRMSTHPSLQARSYATQAAVRPPIALHGLAGV